MIIGQIELSFQAPLNVLAFGESEGRMKFTASQFRAAAALAERSHEEIAKRAGLSPRTLNRLLAQDGAIEARPSTLEKIASAVLLDGIEIDKLGVAVPPLVSVALPPERLAVLDDRFENVKALAQIAADTRTHECVVDRLSRVTDRVTVVYEKGGELYFGGIGGSIPIVKPADRNQKVAEITDREIGRDSAQRNWRAILTGEPSFYFVQRQDLHFTILTIPTRRPGSNQNSQTVTTAFEGIPYLGA